MIVLVDTTIWSLCFRRRFHSLNDQELLLAAELGQLVSAGQAALIGPIRQELLSGIRDPKGFLGIRESLGDFPYLEIVPSDYDRSAQLFNLCRAHGVTGTPIDLLICAVALRYDAAIFTTDTDFQYYAPHTGNRLHMRSVIH